MREIRTSGSMSGLGKPGASAAAPRLDSTERRKGQGCTRKSRRRMGPRRLRFDRSRWMTARQSSTRNAIPQAPSPACVPKTGVPAAVTMSTLP